MTSNEIKFKIKSILPKKLFKVFYFVYVYIMRPLIRLYYKLKLMSFTEETFVFEGHDEVYFHIAVSPDNGTVDTEIYLHGVYEPYYLSRIKKELRVGDTFVDIGANIGQHSLFASQVVGPSGKVIAFEPIPNLCEQLKRSVSKNIINNKCKNVQVYNIGCGEEDAKMNIYMTKENMGGSSVVVGTPNSKSMSIGIVNTDKAIELGLLNAVFPSLTLPTRKGVITNTSVDFVKIDVEGYEYKVLSGMSGTIAKYLPKIFLEYSLDSYDKYAKGDAENIIKLLNYFNYSIIDLDNKDAKVTLKYINKMRAAGIDQANFLAIAN